MTVTGGEQALAKGGGGSSPSGESMMAGGSTRELVQSLALPINELDAQQTLLLGKEEAAGALSGSVRPGRSIIDNRACIAMARLQASVLSPDLAAVGSACCWLVAGFIKLLTQLALALVLVGPNPQSLMVGRSAPQLLPPASLSHADGVTVLLVWLVVGAVRICTGRSGTCTGRCHSSSSSCGRTCCRYTLPTQDFSERGREPLMC